MRKLTPYLTILIIHHLSFLYCQGQSVSSSMIPVHAISVIPKMCSCQLVELQLQDDTKQHVGIFAERDQVLAGKNNFRLMDAMIRKEKNYLVRGFVDDIKVLDSYRSHTDCMTLYVYLRKQNKQFRICDILNVDVLLNTPGH